MVPDPADIDGIEFFQDVVLPARALMAVTHD